MRHVRDAAIATLSFIWQGFLANGGRSIGIPVYPRLLAPPRETRDRR